MLIQQRTTYYEAVTFAKRKDQFSTDTENGLGEVLKKLKHQQLLTVKQNDLTVPVTSHLPMDLLIKNTDMEQALWDLKITSS